jgi:hypothetical protein
VPLQEHVLGEGVELFGLERMMRDGIVGLWERREKGRDDLHCGYADVRELKRRIYCHDSRWIG